MPATPTRADVIAVISVIVSVIGIIVSIILVRDGRKFVGERMNSINRLAKKIWAYYFSRLLVLLIIGIVFQVVLVKLNYIGFSFAIALISVLIIAFLMMLSLHNSLYRSLGKINREVKKSSLSINSLTRIEKVELSIIKERWGEFLEQVSSNISFTAIFPILTMAEPFDVNALEIVVLVPDILESSVRNLDGRLRDLEPLLENIYNKPYKLLVHTSRDVRPFSVSPQE